MKPNKSRDVLTRHERRPAWKCCFHNQEEPPQSVERPVRHRKQLWTCHVLAVFFWTSIFLRWHCSTSRTVQGGATLRRKPEPGAASTCKKSSPTTWTTLNPGFLLRPKDGKASRRRLLSWIQSLRSTFDINRFDISVLPIAIHLRAVVRNQATMNCHGSEPSTEDRAIQIVKTTNAT